MKFGGTSMGSAERMRVAAGIIAEHSKTRPVAVVVSAMSKITDLLLETLRRAELGDRAAVDAELRALLDRHLAACTELFTGPATSWRDAAVDSVYSLVSEFQRITNGVLMLSERPPRSVDEALSIGERLSSVLLAQYLEATGVKSR